MRISETQHSKAGLSWWSTI